MDDPSSLVIHVVSIEVNLCFFLVPLVFVWERKNKKEKKERGFLLQDFSRSNMQCDNWVQSKKQTLNCLSGVCNNPVQSKKQHLIICLKCVTTQCSQKSHTWFVCLECMSEYFTP
jgi:hypothetical protein